MKETNKQCICLSINFYSFNRFPEHFSGDSEIVTLSPVQIFKTVHNFSICSTQKFTIFMKNLSLNSIGNPISDSTVTETGAILMRPRWKTSHVEISVLTS